MVTLSIVERFFKMFSLLESWLNLLQDTCNVFHHTFKLLPLYLAKRNKNGKLLIHYSTFEINQRVKLVKLFVKMFSVSSVVLDNSLKTFSIHQCCCWWKSESSLHSINRMGRQPVSTTTAADRIYVWSRSRSQGRIEPPARRRRAAIDKLLTQA